MDFELFDFDVTAAVLLKLQAELLSMPNAWWQDLQLTRTDFGLFEWCISSRL
jgi:hypothetical protein